MALKILVVDDIPKNREEAMEKIRKELGDNGIVSEFPVSAPTGPPQMHEVRLAEDLTGVKDDVALIVADRDLSAYQEYVGLSESTVQRVADNFGIPECGYARGEGDSQDEFIREGRYREACIRIAQDDDFAKKVVSIAKGFHEIEQALSERQIGSAKPSGAKTLSDILKKPHLADKIALYASGDHSRLTALDRPGKDGGKFDTKRLSCFLGYWLWDSILRFPGIVVGEVSASSYLNINKDEFKEAEVQALFSSARYGGPFADAKSKLWWRSSLDDLVGDSGDSSGLEYAVKLLGRELQPSQCCDDRTIKAGYYCFLKNAPVSYTNSKPGLAWFPRGADLTRISNSEYAEKVPWL